MLFSLMPPGGHEPITIKLRWLVRYQGEATVLDLTDRILMTAGFEACTPAPATPLVVRMMLQQAADRFPASQDELDNHWSLRGGHLLARRRAHGPEQFRWEAAWALAQRSRKPAWNPWSTLWHISMPQTLTYTRGESRHNGVTYPETAHHEAIPQPTLALAHYVPALHTQTTQTLVGT